MACKLTDQILNILKRNNGEYPRSKLTNNIPGYSLLECVAVLDTLEDYGVIYMSTSARNGFSYPGGQYSQITVHLSDKNHL